MRDAANVDDTKARIAESLPVGGATGGAITMSRPAGIVAGGPNDSPFARACVELRKVLKAAGADVKDRISDVKTGNHLAPTPQSEQSYAIEDRGEMLANLMLTYRHIEDASMRLGKAIQASNGGASVYDRDSTVGA